MTRRVPGRPEIVHPMTEAQLRRAVAAESPDARLELSEGGAYYRASATAPDGTVWRSDGLHEIVETTAWPGPAKWKHQVHADLLSRVRMGLENCPDADSCEFCHPVSEEDA